MSYVAIVDYGLCNLDSVKRAVEECGGSGIITDREQDLEKATHIILPGVGAFGEAMANLRKNGLDEILSEQVLTRQIPFLGICLGMQLMISKGTEGGEHLGLGWIEGDVVRFAPAPELRVPHIGWNEVYFQRDSILNDKVQPASNFYFVHSYHVSPHNPSHVLATTPYGNEFASAVCKGDWIFGVQFHPEKSQKVGFQLLRNFLAL